METTKKTEKKAICDVYVNYTWRKGKGRKYQLYKSVSSQKIKRLGRSETSILFIKKGETIPEMSKCKLEYRLAAGLINR